MTLGMRNSFITKAVLAFAVSILSFAPDVAASPLYPGNNNLFRRQTPPTCPTGIATPVGGCVQISVGNKNALTNGKVCLSVKGSDLIVDYNPITTVNGQPVTATYTKVNLYVGTTKPTNRAPGHFPFGSVDGDTVCTIGDGTSPKCTIALSKLGTCAEQCADPPVPFYIAAHADISITDSAGTTSTKTGWGVGTCFDGSPEKGFCAQWFTFTFDCTPPPNPDPECTKGGTAYCKIEKSYAFSQAWGWVLTPKVSDITGSGIEGTLWMGAGQSETSKGTDVGSCKLTISNGVLTIKYSFDSGFKPGTSHVYVSSARDPGDFVAPGQLGFQQDSGHEYTFTTSDVDSPWGTGQNKLPGSTMSYLTVGDKPLYFILHVEILNTCPVA